MIVHKNIFNALNMQNNSWNTINFFQVLIIEILQLMKPIPQMFFDNSHNCAPFTIFKIL
jgi:hypothetical protein